MLSRATIALLAALSPVSALRLASFAASRRASSITMGWSSPNWNWGSAVGDAHDQAMKVRSSLSTPEVRIQFLQDNAAGDVDMEDAKMALALKCQRARNVGYDDRGKWEQLMESMTACDFEGDDGPEKLAAALAKATAKAKATATAGRRSQGVAV